MVEESSPLLPPAEESIEAEIDTAREPEPESGIPTPEPARQPGFLCACEEEVRSACKGLPFYGQHQGWRYCVLHYPGKEKSDDFKAALATKINDKDFDFRGVWFPDEVDFKRFEFSAAVYFTSATFNGGAEFTGATFLVDADFSYATFSAETLFSDATFGASADFTLARFEQIDFSTAEFKTHAYFRLVKFNAYARFNGAEFRSWALFSSSEFNANVDFGYTRFNVGVDFVSAIINGQVDFGYANLAGSLRFSGEKGKEIFGDQSSLDFQYARIEKPERISFHTVFLRPHWFVNVKTRDFDFIDVKWRGSLDDEIESLTAKEVPSPHRLLSIAYRDLAVNAEANNRYEEASRFRYWAMECRRQEQWTGFSFWKQFWNRAVAALTQLKEYRIVSPFTRNWLHWLYWVFSGYGERIRRSLAWLIVVWIVFAVFYTRVGFTQPAQQSSTEGIAAVISEDNIGHPIEWRRAFIYSLAVMSLQKPEPKPLTGTAQTLVLLETILGPVQAALLALAIRRKFMR